MRKWSSSRVELLCVVVLSLVLMVIVSNVGADLVYEHIATPFSMPARYLPAQAQLNNIWTYSGGGEHPSIEGAELEMETDLWDFDLNNNIWINKTGITKKQLPTRPKSFCCLSSLHFGIHLFRWHSFRLFHFLLPHPLLFFFLPFLVSLYFHHNPCPLPRYVSFPYHRLFSCARFFS